jgi:GcrA cell cycle regulator
MPAPSWWTEDRTEKLKKLYASGYFSCSGIAAEMGDGVTRNAIIGKMHRLGLSGQIYIKRRCSKTPEEKEETKRLKEERRRERRRTQRGDFFMVRARPTNLEALRCIEINPLHKSLLDLGPNDCRYPYGDNAPYTFCGHPKLEGHSYCGTHFGISARRGWGS